jgi:hypothetical protein
MTIVKGLKNISTSLEKNSPQDGDRTKARWVKLDDAQSVKIRFLQELDPDSQSYNEKAGLGFIAAEHTNPKNYRAKLLCTSDDQGRCYGCEEHRKDYKAGWKARSRLYVNVLVDDGKEDPYVGILSQGTSGKSITPTLIEYATEMGSISNLTWRLKRSGTGTSTEYVAISLGQDSEPFDISSYELYDLEKVAVRDVPYEEQEKFYQGGGMADPEQSADPATSSNLDW